MSYLGDNKPRQGKACISSPATGALAHRSSYTLQFMYVLITDLVRHGYRSEIVITGVTEHARPRVNTLMRSAWRSTVEEKSEKNRRPHHRNVDLEAVA